MGEIPTMPFSQVYTVSRADEGSREAYLFMYVMAYSAVHIFAPLVGTYLAKTLVFRYFGKCLVLLRLFPCSVFAPLLNDEPLDLSYHLNLAKPTEKETLLPPGGLAKKVTKSRVETPISKKRRLAVYAIPAGKLTLPSW